MRVVNLRSMGKIARNREINKFRKKEGGGRVGLEVE